MPKPQAEVIKRTVSQEKILSSLARRSSNPYRLVRRAELILQASVGESNSQISRQLQLHRHQVRLWRKRWQEAAPTLKQVEGEGNTKLLEQRICEALSDELRPGTPAQYSREFKLNKEFILLCPHNLVELNA